MLGGPAPPLLGSVSVARPLKLLFFNEEGEPLDLVVHNIRLDFEVEVLGGLREETPQHMARAVCGQLC